MKQKLSTVKWIYKHTKSFIPQVIIISLLNVIAAVCYIFLAKLSQQIIDTASSKSNHDFLIGSIFLFGLILFHIID